MFDVFTLGKCSGKVEACVTVYELAYCFFCFHDKILFHIFCLIYCVGCTPIKSSADLKQVLKKVPVTIISPEELCAHLNFKTGTCVRRKEKTSSSLSQKYMEQHPNPCWEHIVKYSVRSFTCIRLPIIFARNMVFLMLSTQNSVKRNVILDCF